MFTKIRPATVLFVVADGVYSNTQEEGDAEPNQCAPCTVEILVVPYAGFEPSSDLVQRPHGPHQHGSGVPTFSNHARHDQGHNTGEERCPVTDVTVVTFLCCDAELIDNTHRAKVVKGTCKSQNPDDQSNDQWHVLSVEAVGLTKEGKPTLFSGWHEGSSCEHTGQQARDGEYRKVRKEDVCGGLTLKVHGRNQLSAFQVVRRGQCTQRITGSSQCDPETNG